MTSLHVAQFNWGLTSYRDEHQLHDYSESLRFLKKQPLCLLVQDSGVLTTAMFPQICCKQEANDLRPPFLSFKCIMGRTGLHSWQLNLIVAKGLTEERIMKCRLKARQWVEQKALCFLPMSSRQSKPSVLCEIYQCYTWGHFQHFYPKHICIICNVLLTGYELK